ncbi:hypothetical protein GGTG_10169 [Gaeumannomyces tritici R3-111a-1]|uniref:Uncharacterized protein n=1 Tax=Gaeumannomyces tritici (strain R3-111a-1) TaxID=644352 RepID=J3P9I9_GAET3|nr:hypothetical protein GGTG_10169 [Gaeumannomyces tritici R3-111a-1]EJT73325.1 hypothetical protein GGTG_10169 [Gaeumannomyces tritici R3-111a-1]
MTTVCLMSKCLVTGHQSSSSAPWCPTARPLISSAPGLNKLALLARPVSRADALR